MSATGRGAVRAVANYYPTPRWPVRRLLEAFTLPEGPLLEPGAGEGHLIRSVNALAGPRIWTAVELREACRPLLAKLEQVTVEIVSFLRWDARGRCFAAAIGNPPFPEAVPFVEVALTCCALVILLLPVGLLGSKERAEWWPLHMPDLYVVPDRISFRGAGADQGECAWYVWDASNLIRRFGRYTVLRHTPRAERLEDRGQLRLLLPPPQLALPELEPGSR